MPQLFVILGSRASSVDRRHQVMLCLLELRSIIERKFGLEGKNDVAVTVIDACFTDNEADIQVEVRYTAGRDEYGTGSVFDPPLNVQANLATEIRNFLKERTPFTVSVWCKPHYGGVFIPND